MDLDGIEAGIDGVPGRSCAQVRTIALHSSVVSWRGVSHPFGDRFAGRTHGLPQLSRRPRPSCGREGAHAVHRPLRRRLASTVGELNADRGFLTLHEGDERLEALHLRIVPDAKVVLVDQADLFDAGGLDKDQPKASQGIAAEMHV